MTTPIGLTRAEFARISGVNRSTVTRWADAGRLVLLTDGSVDADASLVRLKATAGGRDDVADRWAAFRAGNAPATPRNQAQGAPDGPVMGGSGLPPVDNASGVDSGAFPRAAETRAEAQARKEAAAADLLEIELQEKRAQVIPRADVETALRALGAAVRAQLDLLPDQVAPLVAPVADLDDCHAILADAARAALHQLGQQVERVRADLTAGRGL